MQAQRRIRMWERFVTPRHWLCTKIWISFLAFASIMASGAIPGFAPRTQGDFHVVSSSSAHPLDPLTPEEITAVSLVVRKYLLVQEQPVRVVKFVTVCLLPPPKRAVLAHLGIPIAPGERPQPPTKIVKKADVDLLDVLNGHAYNVILSLSDSVWSVDCLDKLPDGQQPHITVEELIACEDIVRNDERVQKLALDVGIQPDQICADGWSIGYDERFPQSRRVQQAFMFARLSEHENLYAHPLDFIPIIDAGKREVIHIDFPPHYKSGMDGLPRLSTEITDAPSLTVDALQASGRERIKPPLKKFDFLADLLARSEGFEERGDLKPLHVVQPEGVSFTMKGHVLEWQKWRMHIAFSHREGIVLSTITYNDNGQLRPIFYRLGLAEMVVPYAAPEHPHPRKFAFDVGEYGMGTQANDLALGCDCLGRIHYLPGAYVAENGNAVVINKAICIHEEDAGLLWKHTDFRPGGRARTVRSRRLVISMVCTVANYEYIWNYFFYQDGTIEFETRLTGILQVYPSSDDEPASSFGTMVAPNIHAHYHQHVFSIRVDPMIDGLQNSVVETDIVPLPDAPTGSQSNFAGNAFIARSTVLKDQKEGSRDYDFDKDRRWKIVNPSKKHYSSGKEVGFVVDTKGAALKLMSRADSWASRRAAFATKAVWVVKDVEGPKGGRLWPSGKYVPQTRGEPEESVSKWIQSGGSIENEDIVLFFTIGTTHIPRPEDWPVMPVKRLGLTFTPESFFALNPSIDVPEVNDSHSAPAFPNGTGDHDGADNCCSH